MQVSFVAGTCCDTAQIRQGSKAELDPPQGLRLSSCACNACPNVVLCADAKLPGGLHGADEQGSAADVAALAYQPFSWGPGDCVGRRMGLLQVLMLGSTSKVSGVAALAYQPFVGPQKLCRPPHGPAAGADFLFNLD